MIGNKKMKELIWLKKFRAKTDLEFEILDNNREQPDFLVRFDGRRVGVEITELQIDQNQIGPSKGSELQKKHGIKAEIVNRAQIQYFESGYRSINATFLFELGSTSLSTVNRWELAKSIVVVLGQLHLGDMEKFRLDRYSDLPVPPPVTAIYACGLPEGIGPHWQLTNAGWSRKLQPSDIKSILDKKNQLVDHYRKSVCENWLLVVADGCWPHGRFLLPTLDHEEWPESEFERTYIFCEPDRFLIQLSEGGWAQIAGSTKFRGVKQRDRPASERRAGGRGRRLDVQPSMSATLTPRNFVLPTSGRVFPMPRPIGSRAVGYRRETRPLGRANPHRRSRRRGSGTSTRAPPPPPLSTPRGCAEATGTRLAVGLVRAERAWNRRRRAGGTCAGPALAARLASRECQSASRSAQLLGSLWKLDLNWRWRQDD